MQIIYSPKFRREYKSLPIEMKSLAEKREKIFRGNPFHPTLKTHKLKGKWSEFWSFSVDFKNRIIFEFGEGNRIVFHSIGDHEIYQ